MRLPVKRPAGFTAVSPCPDEDWRRVEKPDGSRCLPGRFLGSIPLHSPSEMLPGPAMGGNATRGGLANAVLNACSNPDGGAQFPSLVRRSRGRGRTPSGHRLTALPRACWGWVS